MTFPESRPDDAATNRAALLIAQALAELRQSGAVPSKEEQAQMRAAIDRLAERLDQQIAEEKAQRLALAGQLNNLATSLDRLVSHLEGLSTLMTSLIDRVSEPEAAAPAQTPERPFPAGGEGVTLMLSGVPGFQGLMEIQKALLAMEQVSGASVERFQEADSRILLMLRAPLTAAELSTSLRQATNHAFVVEESRPELLRLRLKIVSGT